LYRDHASLHRRAKLDVNVLNCVILSGHIDWLEPEGDPAMVAIFERPVFVGYDSKI
jgi:hypothetical protein